MSIETIAARYIGCGRYCSVCPGSLIRLGADKRAGIPHPERCWGCASCVKGCPVQAIAVFLGKGTGGLGGRLTVRREDTLLHWTVTNPDGSAKTITVDSRDLDQYQK